MKKLISLFLASALCLSLSIPAFASSPDGNFSAPEFLPEFISTREPQASISEVVPLYNTDSNIIAWLYTLNPTGYIVLDESQEIVVEFSFSNNIEYLDDSPLYYGGPTQFYQNDGSFYNIRTQAPVSESSLDQKSSSFVDTTALMLNDPVSGISPIANTPPYSIDSSEFQLYDYNPDGRCGSVAAAILLAYYKDNGYSGLVSSTHYNNDVSFTNYLVPHIEDLDDISGSYPADVASGLNWYLEQKGYDSKLSAYYSDEDFSSYTKKIDAGDPVCLLMNGEPTYNNHWVVGYGYDYDQIIIKYNRFAIVDDGWGDIDININWDYIVSLVYLKEV